MVALTAGLIDRFSGEKQINRVWECCGATFGDAEDASGIGMTKLHSCKLLWPMSEV